MKPTRLKLRDLFFGTLATGILIHEILVSPPPEPLTAFLILWFYGFIPVAWADDARRAAAQWLIPKASSAPPIPPPEDEKKPV